MQSWQQRSKKYKRNGHEEEMVDEAPSRTGNLPLS
jgi:hypothetical protein